ncbi:MAG: molecular chaperone HtpG [Calditrichaeota bacterium]|nr:MAG: molecular chaperone HtpG [Calditrichota bacterium]MBL1205706.1 molecular chaperone HtpG [Calditrichota bacterium]NOG45534.1 molecular chaperone HtpG [Calditrichota bacterium]
MKFKTEVNKLLDILTHSLYSNREIFLRELISNASDALDKLRFESTRGTDLADSDLPLEVCIDVDEAAKQITITDTGIGMNEEDIIANLGTIAKSGTEAFLNMMAENGKAEEKDKDDASTIIGKFGVGFYSVFMAADKVVVTSKSFKKDDAAVRWTSDGLGSFSLEVLDNGDVKRGTSIEIHLREDANDFASKDKIKEVIKKHSNFVNFPINIDGEKANTVTALWREPKFKIKQEEYDEFYKFVSHDFQEPMDTIHVSVDAPVQFNALVFIPKQVFDMFGSQKDDRGLDLYVNGVLIQNKNKDLIPEYLAFCKGLVESPDIPLNVSRETLQENLVVKKISQALVKQILSHLAKKAKKEAEKYETFWKEHGKIFKFGYQDFENKDKFADLLLFNSSANENADQLTSLAQYVERMKEDQKEIYYLTGASRAAIESDPHLEIFKRKGLEAFYLYEPVDEFALSGLSKYKDFELKAVEQVDLGKLESFKEEEKEGEEKAKSLSKADEKIFDKLLKRIKDILGERVTDVKESQRLHDSASCLVNPDGSMTSHMHKMMQMMNKDSAPPQKIMEINKDHKLTRNLLKIYKADPRDAFIDNAAEQLFESALLLEGYLTDPHKLVNRINDVLEQSSDWHPASK